MKKEFIGSTIGMLLRHENLSGTKLVRFEYYRTGEKILIVPVSGHNLSTFRAVKQVEISKEDYSDRPRDCYNDSVEFNWAKDLLGFY